MAAPGPLVKRVPHWSVMAERGSVWGLRSMLLAYRYGGHWLARVLLYPIIGYFFVTGRTARRASRGFLATAAQQPSSPLPFRPGWWLSYHHFLNFGRAALIRLDGWSGRISRSAVDFNQRDQLVAQLDSGRGAVLLTSHLGHIEMCRALAEQDYRTRINVVVLTANAVQFNRILAEISPDSQLNLIQVSEMGPDTAILLAECIERGELVAIAADRTPAHSYGRVTELPFMGRPAAFPQGPFILAALLRCPVYSLFCLQQANGRFSVELAHLSDSLAGPRGSRDQRIAAVTADYVRQLERLAIRYPLQWFNFYDFWCPDRLDVINKG